MTLTEDLGWADIVDDPGDLTSGTALEKVIIEAWRTAVDNQVHSVANPSITPKDLIDEVVTARGNLANLNARIGGVISPDSLFINNDFFSNTQNVLDHQGPENYLGNDTFLLWTAGDAAAPDYWTLSGAGAVIARTGAGLGDTTEYKLGYWTAKVTYGSASAILSQSVIKAGTTVETRLEEFSKSQDFADSVVGGNTVQRCITVAVAVKSSVGSQARISLTSDSGTTYSGYHSGDGTWDILAVAEAINQQGGSGGPLRLDLIVDGSGSAYFAACRLGHSLQYGGGLSAPLFHPTRWTRREEVIHLSGAQTAGTRKWAWAPRRPGIITDVYLSIGTAPTGQALIVDLNTWDGAAMTSMYTTKPQIAAAATEGTAQPDTTYARRCFRPVFTSSKAAGYLVTLDIDQVGSGVAGSDLTVTIGYLTCDRPLEQFYNFDTLG